MSINKTIEARSLEELREFAREITQENRRLRMILDTLTRAGIGKGARVEVHFDEEERAVGVVVCRADVDERAFSESIRDALEGLAESLGGEMLHDSTRVTGVTADGEGR